MDHNNETLKTEQGRIGAGKILLVAAIFAVIGFFIYPNIIFQKGEEAAPAQIKDLSGEAGDSQVYLSWSAPTDGGSKITAYLVKYSDGRNDNTTDTTSTSITIDRLTNGTRYSFSVAAVNAIGTSEYSPNLELTPEADSGGGKTSPGPVTKITTSTGLDSSKAYIDILWEAPDSNGGSKITGYEVGYKTTNESDFTIRQLGPETSFKISDLQPKTIYDVRVYAVNEFGSSEAVEFQVETPPSPEPGGDLEFSAEPSVSTTNSSATITWGTSKSASSQVSYGATNDLGRMTEKFNTTPMVKGHTVTLENLLSCTVYAYKVFSYDDAENMLEGTKGEFRTSGCKGDAEILVSQKGKATAEAGVTLNAKEAGRGLSVVVPSAVKTGTDVAIQALIVSKEEVVSEISNPSGKVWVGKSYVLSAIEDSTTEVTSFDKPVTVSIDYQNADIEGIDPQTLKIWHYEDGAGWRELSSCSTALNGVGGTVTCSTTSFSIFGIFGESENEGSNNGDSNNSSSGTTSTGSVPKVTNNTTQVENNAVDLPLVNQPTSPNAPEVVNAGKYNFTKDLWYQIKDMEVKMLQKFLNTKGFTVSDSGAGSVGQETDFFGPKTKEALIKFQEAYKVNILTPIGLNLGTGFFGPQTRNFINSLQN